MSTFLRKRRPPPGARPGTLAIAHDAVVPRLTLIRYNQHELHEETLSTVVGLRGRVPTSGVLWLDVQGMGDEALLRALAEELSIHPLALEDLVHVPQRPKMETYEQHDLWITRAVHTHGALDLQWEQVSFIVGEGYVLSFQQRHGDDFEPVRARLRDSRGPMRKLGADYLAYALLDTIVDHYFPVGEAVSDDLEALEDVVMRRPSPRALERLSDARGAVVSLRRAVLPLRDALRRVARTGSPFVSEDVQVYMRDTLDHAAQLVELVESQRDFAMSLLNVYMLVVSHRTNEVMKVLTIMASIFIPLTFVAGVYGMNFDVMPELHHQYGYPAVLGVMVASTVGMLIYFRRKGWLGSEDDNA